MGHIVTVKKHITAKNFVNILSNHVNRMVKMLFLHDDVLFQDNKASAHLAWIDQDWISKYEE